MITFTSTILVPYLSEDFFESNAKFYKEKCIEFTCLAQNEFLIIHLTWLAFKFGRADCKIQRGRIDAGVTESWKLPSSQEKSSSRNPVGSR